MIRRFGFPYARVELGVVGVIIKPRVSRVRGLKNDDRFFIRVVVRKKNISYNNNNVLLAAFQPTERAHAIIIIIMSSTSNNNNKNAKTIVYSGRGVRFKTLRRVSFYRLKPRALRCRKF